MSSASIRNERENVHTQPPSRRGFFIGFITALSCATLAGAVRGADPLNALSDQEKHDGWQLLFDGHSTKGWMTVKNKPLPERHVQQGSLNPHPCDYMLVYDQPQENYVLSLDFKISPKCNSGVFVRTFPL